MYLLPPCWRFLRGRKAQQWKPKTAVSIDSDCETCGRGGYEDVPSVVEVKKVF